MQKPVPISWFDNSTLKHLRFPFSFFLMPVFLFALSQAGSVNWPKTILAFIILHLLVFPSSNGYNSYQDRDETPIGGLKNPPKVSENLFYATLLFDVLAILLGLFISAYFSAFVSVFVVMSRLYSNRKVRLKKYAVIGFLTVFIFQGAFVFLMASAAISPFYPEIYFTTYHLICMVVASLFIGSIYPLTQIYQHEADKNDGVISISYKLGYIGTFIFSGILFSVAVLFLIYYFELRHQQTATILFLILMVPVIYKLSVWFNRVRKDTANANFENTMSMNLLTSAFMNLYFIVLTVNNYFTWF